MNMKKWTTEMEAYLIVQRTVDKTPYKLLSVRLNKKFNTKFKVHDLQNKAHRLGIRQKQSKPEPSPKPVKVKSRLAPKMDYFKPNQEQINFVHAMNLNGFVMEKIRQAYLEQYERKLSNIQITTTLRKAHTLELPKEVKPVKKEVLVVGEVKPLKVSNAPDWHSDIATRKQCRCIITITTDLKGSAKTKATNELYNSEEYTKLQARDLIKANQDKLFGWKKKPPTTREKHNLTTPHNPNTRLPSPTFDALKHSIKKRSAYNRWTKEEDAFLYDFKKQPHEGRQTWPVMEGRTLGAIKTRWYDIRHTIRSEIYAPATPTKSFEEMAEEVNEYIGDIPLRETNVAETMWTKEDDLDLLCNFYEYSIDEARNRFNVPYSVIANRLETLIDSTEPNHIEMLMEATKTIKARRKQAADEAKNGFWKRRKLRKQAKKEAKKERRIEYRLQRLEAMFSKRRAKLDRKVAKAEKRLKKLKGE